MFKQTNSLGFLFVMLIYITACTPTNNQYKTVKLNNSWRIQSSEHVTAKGDEISNSEFDVSGWYKAEVPQTVLAALVQDSVYIDIYKNDNLKNIPTANLNHRGGIAPNLILKTLPQVCYSILKE